MQTITKAQVLQVKHITEAIFEFILVPEKYKRFEVGSFLQFTFDLVTASDIWPDSRPFSIASSWNKEEKKIRLIVKKNGNFTTRMFEELKEGSECTLKYSFGDMVFPSPEQEQEIVMIAGGTGIAPFLGFSEEINKRENLCAKLFYSVRYAHEFIDVEKFKAHIGETNVHLFCTGEQHEQFEKRRISITDIIDSKMDVEHIHFYVCGSPAFINYYRAELEIHGANHIFIDEWE